MDTLTESHQIELILLSIFIGIIASYAALDLAGRVTSTSGKTRTSWLISGSVVLGAGIWSLHFIAMIGHYIPVPVSYDVVLTVLSMIAGMAGSFAALFIISSNPHHPRRIALAGAALGLGIILMHYIGMAGMIMPAEIHYNSWQVILSMIFAVGGALLTFSFWHWYLNELTPKASIYKSVSALCLAAGIAGLHYTAMAAASFTPSEQSSGQFSFTIIETPLLTAGVAISSVAILTIMVLSTAVDRRMSIQSQRIRCLFDNHPGMIFELDENNCIVSVNDAYKQIMGTDYLQILYKPFPLLAEKREDKTRIQHHLQRTLQNESRSFDMTLTHQDGTPMYLKVTTIPIVIGGRVQGMYGMAENVTELKKAEDKLRTMAYYDYLTGVLNFRGYQQKMKDIVSQEENYQHICILYIDCDGFKEVNDTLGHEAGDVFLTYFAQLLQTCTASDDIISRVGGDEFVVVTHTPAKEEVVSLAEMILTRLNEPWIYDDKTFEMTASIGISFYPDNTTDITTLLHQADEAMYQAKRSGKRSYHLYEQEQTIG
ncbi:diguanylate cyclase [Salibacterium salarium]|uniref:Diguanylate cyclase n=1 Tax=Salibacterium salarium TaxID=284579 RepID=A0A3R9QSY7_9BACI|nr:diguanylate cyclase [Salibacterium salarium]RSL32711.1 diguanylate cyclase [Salibacterium salarium]